MIALKSDDLLVDGFNEYYRPDVLTGFEEKFQWSLDSTNNKSINDDINNNAIQIKRLLKRIFPTTNDVYGFHLDEPSIESLQCYEQYAKMACDTCSVPSILLEANHSIASTSSFQIVGSTTNERPKSAQQQQQKICNQTLQSSLMSLFDEPIISDDAIWIYKQSVPVACQGPYEPSDIDRLAYESYVASLMINVQS